MTSAAVSVVNDIEPVRRVALDECYLIVAGKLGCVIPPIGLSSSSLSCRRFALSRCRLLPCRSRKDRAGQF